MNDRESDFISRADIARLAGVARPAVSNWERRHDGFPRPVRKSGDVELFLTTHVLEWLKSRKIPKNARQATEHDGSSYADRFAESLGITSSQHHPDEKQPDPNHAAKREIRKLHWRFLDSVRGTFSFDQSISLLASLIYIAQHDSTIWQEILRASPSKAASRMTEIISRELPDHKDIPSRSFMGLDDFQRHEKLVQVMMREIDSIVDKWSSAEDVGDLMESLLELRTRPDVLTETTPRSVRNTLLKLLESDFPAHRLYDPYCRTGELLVAAAKHQSRVHPSIVPRIRGLAPTSDLYRLAQVNLKIHNIDAELEPPDWVSKTDEAAQHDSDLILCNPPFTIRPPALSSPDKSQGNNAPKSGSFDWLSYTLSTLAENGRAALIMPNGAAFSTPARAVSARKELIENGAVECIVALPSRMFISTPISTMVWVLRSPTGRCESVLFVDGSELGSQLPKTHQRIFSLADVTQIAAPYHTWRSNCGTLRNPHEFNIARSVSLSEIADNDYILTPASYIPAASYEATTSGASSRLPVLIERLAMLKSQQLRADSMVDQILSQLP